MAALILPKNSMNPTGFLPSLGSGQLTLRFFGMDICQSITAGGSAMGAEFPCRRGHLRPILDSDQGFLDQTQRAEPNRDLVESTNDGTKSQQQQQQRRQQQINKKQQTTNSNGNDYDNNKQQITTRNSNSNDDNKNNQENNI